jgi:glycosyltransferase involved in cell wall biosynthesis
LWRYTHLLQSAVKHVDGFLVGSRFSAQKHRQFGLDAPIVYLPPFVAEQERHPAAAEGSLEALFKPYFLFVGRLVRNKGLQTLVPVFRRATQAHLLVAGTGRYEPELRRIAEGSTNIHFLGQVQTELLPNLYRNAIAVIVPSIALEVGPLVVLESFQQQTPVLVRNLGGIPEYVQESGGGLVYDTDEEVLAAMERLLADPTYRMELGMRGYRTYREKWTPEAHLKRYLALIDEIAAASAGKRSCCST